MEAFMLLYDKMNCIKETFRLMKDTSGSPILPSVGDYFECEGVKHKVVAVHWTWEERNIHVLAQELEN